MHCLESNAFAVLNEQLCLSKWDTKQV
jgi:hypothetical protein